MANSSSAESRTAWRWTLEELLADAQLMEMTEQTPGRGGDQGIAAGGMFFVEKTTSLG